MENKYDFTFTRNGHVGSGEVKWIPDSGYIAGHYVAVITVPFRNCYRRCKNLDVYNKNDFNKAIKRAEKFVALEL